MIARSPRSSARTVSRLNISDPINAARSQEYDLSFAYDFDGIGPRMFDLDFERSLTCSGNAGSEYCKNDVRGPFGDAARLLEWLRAKLAERVCILSRLLPGRSRSGRQ